MAQSTSLTREFRIKRDRRTLYELAQDKLMVLIHEGVLAPGTQLPSQDELAAMLGVSRTTLREAVRSITQMGLLEQWQGIGTFVSRSGLRINRGMEILESLESLAERQGWVCGNEEVDLSRVSADVSLAERLGVPENAPVTRVFRIKTANGKRIAHMTDYVPEVVLPLEELRRRFKGSVLDILFQSAQPQVEYASVTLTPCVNSKIAQILRAPPDTPLLLTEERVHARGGQVIDIGETYFLTAFFRFQITRRPMIPHRRR